MINDLNSNIQEEFLGSTKEYFN